MEEKEKTISFNTDFNPEILSVILKRHWFLPFLYVFLFGLFSFFYLRYTKPIYKSNTVIQIIQDDQTSNVLGTASLASDKNILSKEIALLKSDVLFSKAISNLNLETSIYAEGEMLTKDLYRTAPFEIIIYELKDSSLVGNRIDINLNKKNQIQLFSNDIIIATGELDSHLKNDRFDIFIRSIDKKNISILY